MSDTGVIAMSWVKVLAGRFVVVGADGKVSTLRFEAHASYEDVKPVSDLESQQLGLLPNAPLRVLSFDIETMGPKDNTFPHPNRESVIQISSVVAHRRLYPCIGRPEDPFFRCVFTLHTCAPIPGCTIFSFGNGTDLLNEWRKFMVAMDPDIVMGHNILRFDIPYLLLRAKQLGLEGFNVLGRLTNVATTYNHPFQGAPDGWAVAPLFPGRISIDTLHWASDNVNGSQKLDILAHQYLGEGKDSIPVTQIVPLQNGTAETRKRLARYCLKDAHLALKLVDVVGCIQHFYAPTARQSLVSLNSVTSNAYGLNALKNFQAARGRYMIADSIVLRRALSTTTR